MEVLTDFRFLIEVSKFILFILCAFVLFAPSRMDQYIGKVYDNELNLISSLIRLFALLMVYVIHARIKKLLNIN